MQTAPPCGLGPGPVLRDPVCPGAAQDTPPPFPQGTTHAVASPSLKGRGNRQNLQPREKEMAFAEHLLCAWHTFSPPTPPGGKLQSAPSYSQEKPRSPKGRTSVGVCPVGRQGPVFSWTVPGGAGMWPWEVPGVPWRTPEAGSRNSGLASSPHPPTPESTTMPSSTCPSGSEYHGPYGAFSHL